MSSTQPSSSNPPSTSEPAVNLNGESTGGQATPGACSGLVGDRRISLGAKQGGPSSGLAAQMEQGYRQAREVVRANNGIKVLLQLLQPRIITPSTALDCLRALACRVLLGLARDDTIAHILTKLQVYYILNLTKYQLTFNDFLVLILKSLSCCYRLGKSYQSLLGIRVARCQVANREGGRQNYLRLQLS